MHFTNGVSFIRCKKTLASARCSTVHGLLSKELWHPSQIQGQALDSHWLTASPPTWPTSTCTDLPTPSHNSPHTHPPCLLLPLSPKPRILQRYLFHGRSARTPLPAEAWSEDKGRQIEEGKSKRKGETTLTHGRDHIKPQWQSEEPSLNLYF